MAIGSPPITWDLKIYRRTVGVHWYTSAEPFGEYRRDGMYVCMYVHSHLTRLQTNPNLVAVEKLDT